MSDEARRRELERLLRKMDEDAAVLEMRQETHPLSPKHLRWLAQLDRCRAQVPVLAAIGLAPAAEAARGPYQPRRRPVRAHQPAPPPAHHPVPAPRPGRARRAVRRQAAALPPRPALVQPGVVVPAAPSGPAPCDRCPATVPAVSGPGPAGVVAARRVTGGQGRPGTRAAGVRLVAARRITGDGRLPRYPAACRAGQVPELARQAQG